ncbi:Copper-sensitive operon repressor [Oligella ureolytica]|uniref:Copper-sensitive operon repressor n=1 Tax=Oligella ureolytica TaxID=90244 RepID=A0A378XHH7_9BURK|nr:metal-sensing transcriptional repressor [Oligella ureolytica]QPT39893.1 metal-sensing transcriptional repressor [Oligella ureolytica]SUA51958.1 Copper-sensitive operon repressor [Oligella ureolytica]SUA57905.1 Copper-sensitive operon repressor [Oligella ureolytica]
MTHPDKQLTHQALIKRLKRAQGHLLHVISMIEEEQTCVDIAVQLTAVERAITAAKRVLIHDHIDQCLTHDTSTALEDMKALAKLL